MRHLTLRTAKLGGGEFDTKPWKLGNLTVHHKPNTSEEKMLSDLADKKLHS